MLLIDNDIKIETCNDVRDIFFNLLESEIKYSNKEDLPDGEIFRKDKVYVMKDSIKKIHEGVYPESKIIEYMTKAQDILNDDKNMPLINIALFHYIFGYIHPFYDGNGRVNRFICSYKLSKTMSKLIGIKLAQVIKANRSSYYKNFEETNDEKNRADATEFVIKFLKTIEKEIDELLSSLVEKKDLYNYTLSNIKNIKLSSSDDSKEKVCSTLLEYTLFSYKGLTVKDIVDITKLNERIVYKILHQLDSMGMIISSGEKRKCSYLFDYSKL